jgi:hypothetical protein
VLAIALLDERAADVTIRLLAVEELLEVGEAIRRDTEVREIEVLKVQVPIVELVVRIAGEERAFDVGDVAQTVSDNVKVDDAHAVLDLVVSVCSDRGVERFGRARGGRSRWRVVHRRWRKGALRRLSLSWRLRSRLGEAEARCQRFERGQRGERDGAGEKVATSEMHGSQRLLRWRDVRWGNDSAWEFSTAEPALALGSAVLFAVISSASSSSFLEPIGTRHPPTMELSRVSGISGLAGDLGVKVLISETLSAKY